MVWAAVSKAVQREGCVREGDALPDVRHVPEDEERLAVVAARRLVLFADTLPYPARDLVGVPHCESGVSVT